jgi:hypothetical protein
MAARLEAAPFQRFIIFKASSFSKLHHFQSFVILKASSFSKLRH